MNGEVIHVEFHGDEHLNEESYIWRYVDIHRFLSFVLNRQIFLTRLDKFKDVREGIPPAHMLFNLAGQAVRDSWLLDGIRDIVSIQHAPDVENNLEDALKKLQRASYASCWFVGRSTDESFAMWYLYSKPNSVAVRIRYHDFKSKMLKHGFKCEAPLKKLQMRPVSYVNFQVPEEVRAVSSAIHHSAFFKDASFSHESEFRIVGTREALDAPNRETWYKKGVSKRHSDALYNATCERPGVNLELIEFDEYDFEVVFHPESQDWAKEDIKSVLRKHEIRFTVLDSRLAIHQ